MRLDRNQGPAAARNLAISLTRSPLIAVLDADDRFLPGRFSRLLSRRDWDLVADNVLFVGDHGEAERAPLPSVQGFFRIDLARFADGNVSRRGRDRAELGFLKPVMRRSFLDRHGLRYAAGLRFGEDYDLYARALACGARFLVTYACGYLALCRQDSLSSTNSAADLARLVECDEHLLRHPGLSGAALAALRRHRNHVGRKHWLRVVLDRKRQDGAAAALGQALARPARLAGLATDVARDKLGLALRPDPARAASAPRFLLDTHAEPAGPGGTAP